MKPRWQTGLRSGATTFVLFFLLAFGSGYGAIMMFAAGVIVAPIVGVVVAMTDRPARPRWHAGVTAGITCAALVCVLGGVAGLGVVTFAAAGILGGIDGAIVAVVR